MLNSVLLWPDFYLDNFLCKIRTVVLYHNKIGIRVAANHNECFVIIKIIGQNTQVAFASPYGSKIILPTSVVNTCYMFRSY